MNGLRNTELRDKGNVYLPGVARTLNNLGNLFRDERQVTDAHRTYEEALGIYRTMSKLAPDRFRADLLMVETNVNQLSD